ncbi:MAG: GMP synthase (glutamine-hydrolyzing), partial [bacterium]|nr:GMP synthase (glutamine-hydrolyzing) [bacterium]
TAILHPELKDDLLAVCIDTGALRMGELEQIKKVAQIIGVKLKVIKATRQFQKVLNKTIDAEAKRKKFAGVYARILKEVAKQSGAVIIQGSLATDFIESGKAGKAIKIKSHHNVGLAGLHPLNSFFKYEIRDLAHEVGLPKQVRERQPFPGPGLFIRIIGAPVTFAKLSIVRWADMKVTNIVKKAGIYDEISQLIVALDCSLTVGIKGDGRVYGFAVIVRAVKTSDFMTAEGFQLPAEVRREISTILTQHPKVVRVYFDETNKPPATTELE